LGVGEGRSERERGGVDLGKIALGSPFLCVQVDKTRRIRERERE
jgi:hypothetical protein